MGAALHRSASSAFHPRLGSPGASCGETSNSVEQVEHSIVAILVITERMRSASAPMILPAFGAGVQVGGRMADMQRQPEHLIAERIDATARTGFSRTQRARLDGCCRR